MTRTIRHYTNVVHLPSIVTDGCLRPVNAENPGARPLLWFTEGTADPRGTQASSAHRLLAPVIQSAIENHGTLSFIVPPSDRRQQRWITNWERFGVTPEAFRSLTRLADDYGLDQARAAGAHPPLGFGRSCPQAPGLPPLGEHARGAAAGRRTAAVAQASVTVFV